jgi:peptidoglycan/LPS O-acetylase OafA/YrhL
MQQEERGLKPDLPALTGLRFIAAAAVVFYHYGAQITDLLPAFGMLGPITSAGYLGVDLFFVLSGFILTYNYMESFRRIERRTYLRFLGFRLARIYPVHLFTIAFLALPLLLTVALGQPLSHPENFSIGDLIQNLLLVHAWPRPMHLSWNYPSWSISAEWFAYLLFPMVAFLIVRLRSPTVLVVGAIAAFVVQWSISASLGVADSTLLRVSGEFLTGCFFGRLFLLGWRPTWTMSRPAFASTCLIVAGLLFLPALGLDRGFAAVLFGPTIFALALGAEERGSWLARRPMVFLGNASYALYMVHAIIGDTAFGLAASSFTTAPLMLRASFVAAVLLVMLAVAAAIFIAFERPTRKLVRLAVERSFRS